MQYLEQIASPCAVPRWGLLKINQFYHASENPGEESAANRRIIKISCMTLAGRRWNGHVQIRPGVSGHFFGPWYNRWYCKKVNIYLDYY